MEENEEFNPLSQLELEEQEAAELKEKERLEFEELKSDIEKSICYKLLGESWSNKLFQEFSKPYIYELSKFIQEERKTKTIFPAGENVFKAYELTPLNKVLCVICGLDPYINDKQATGLSFSVPETEKTPPSLLKIQKAIEEDCYNGLKLNKQNDLTYLAQQGVMLLNSVLTVEKGKSGSHVGKGWEEFTGKTLEILANNGNKLVFLSFGNDAKKLTSFVDKDYHLVIETEHPVAGAYQGRPNWNYENCFSRANKFLKENYNQEILW